MPLFIRRLTPVVLVLTLSWFARAAQDKPGPAAIRAAEPAKAAEPAPAPTLPPMPRPPFLPPADSQQLFQLPPGYRIELVLSEPQIKEPAVTVFDGNGRMYVAEMRSYMQDIDAGGEKVANSRVSMHWSSKGNGVYDQHTVFIDALLLPRLMLPLKDSLLVQETDTGDIFEYRDTDGDGIADEKKLFFAGEARKGNMEHQTSGLIWCSDNWLYSTYNSYRIRWTPNGVSKEPTAPNGGQWGLTQDDFGKPWFVNAGGELGPLNFQQPILYGAFRFRDQTSPDYFTVWPLVAIPDVQGGAARFRPQEKTLNNITASCGADIFRGDRLPPDLQGDLLYCEPVGRLIRRTNIDVRDGITYLKNAYDQSEFIRSSDPYFRPVNLVTAPDGTLYITDMYRGIIQQGNWTKKGSYLRSVIEQYELDRGVGRGRIWRLVHDSQTRGATPQMLNESPAQLVQHLAHANGWWRDTAQKLLILNQDKSVVPALKAMVRADPNRLARFHALWTLEGLDALDAGLVREKFSDSDPQIRVAAIRVSESLFKKGVSALKDEILSLCKDPNSDIAIQAMMTASLLAWPEAKTHIRKIAVSSSSAGVKGIGAQLLNPLSAQLPLGYSKPERSLLEKGQQIYMELCFACHGLDARGTPLDGKPGTLAPPLAGSPRVNGHRDMAIRALLHGVTGPIDGQTYESMMTPMGANDDEWVAAVLSYLRTGFGNAATLVTKQDVARVRTEYSGRVDPWTVSDLEPRYPRLVEQAKSWILSTNHQRHENASGGVRQVRLSFSAGPDQVPGTWLQVELPEATEISGVRFGCQKSHRNQPRGYQIQLSGDGETWGEPVAVGKGGSPIIESMFAATRAKFVRITQTGTTSKVAWTVDSIALFTGRPAPGKIGSE